MPPRKLFFSQPLLAVSDAPETEERYRQFYSQIVASCTRYNFTVYDPYEQGHPVKHEFITETAVYRINQNHISESELLIAYVGLPSAGVAMEIEIAHNLGLPVVLLYEVDRRSAVSKMVRGCPAAKFHVDGPDLDGLVAKFESQLGTILTQIFDTQHTPPERDSDAFRAKLNELREETGRSFDQVAERANLDKPYAWRVFNGKVKKPGRNQVLKICAWGLGLSLEQTNDILRSGGYEPL